MGFSDGVDQLKEQDGESGSELVVRDANNKHPFMFGCSVAGQEFTFFACEVRGHKHFEQNHYNNSDVNNPVLHSGIWRNEAFLLQWGVYHDHLLRLRDLGISLLNLKN